MSEPRDSADFETAGELAALVGAGDTLKNIYGITDREMEAMYTRGYNLYNQAKYLEAAKAFAFLLQHDQYERRYYKAFGSCMQMLRRHEEALKYYGMASVLDMMDPEPSFRAAECLVVTGKLDEARSALEACIAQCAQRPGQYGAMAERAKAMLESLRARGAAAGAP